MEHLIPIWDSKYQIKGSQDRPRLVNIRTGKSIDLKNKAIVDLLKLANGVRSIHEISRQEGGLSAQDVYKFLTKFEAVGALRFSDKASPYDIPIQLCPKEPWLKEVHLDVTSNCNLRCRHCLWGNNLSSMRDVSFESWDRGLRQLADYGVLKIVLSGGEALCRKDIDLFVKRITEYGMYLGAIFTNGTFWTDSFSRALNYIQEMGIHTKIYISLDGFTARQHDFLRGDGNFDKTVDFVQRLVAFKQQSNAQLEIAINSFIHRLNYSDLIQ